MTEMEWVANGSDAFRDNSPKNDKQKRQPPAMGNWRDKISYNLSGSPALIVPVEPCKASGEELGFFDGILSVGLCRNIMLCMAASSCCRRAETHGVGSSLDFGKKEAAALIFKAAAI